MEEIKIVKDEIELFEQFEEFGYVTHYCPECKEETLPTEIDAGSAFCASCDKYVKVPYII